MTGGTPKRELNKTKLSMYLRTKCDRELYLSLFSNNPQALKAAGLPIPLKSRPGVQLITEAGREFEYQQYDQLIEAIPSYVVHKSGGTAPISLEVALQGLQAPALILQPQIEPQQFRQQAFDQLGVPKDSQAHIPRLSGLRPDILFVSKPGSATHEVLPDGSRRRIIEGDVRAPICVIDLKNITEANASYSAEVCLYAFFLSN